MKRNPRLMMAVVVIAIMSWLPWQALAQSGPLRLPEGGETIGDPDAPPGLTPGHGRLEFIVPMPFFGFGTTVGILHISLKTIGPIYRIGQVERGAPSGARSSR
jgi:hypothetical protein